MNKNSSDSYYQLGSDALNSIMLLMSGMQTSILQFTDVQDELQVSKLQKNLLKDIALVRTIIETNSTDILDDIVHDIQ
jgi:hypothetical protein